MRVKGEAAMSEPKPEPFKPPRVTGRPTFKELLGPERYAEMKQQAREALERYRRKLS